MNFFLIMYLNFIRGPRIAKEQAEKQEQERREQEEEDRKNGVTARNCKKCDEPIELASATTKIDRLFPVCAKCQARDLAEQQAEIHRMNREMMRSPFLWFQFCVMMLGITVFVHRNVFPLF